jgi:glycosyltransferase involved in cell wall biosynthesis
MRIALVIYGSLEQVSGGFIYDRALLGALAARGHQIDVVALPWHSYARAIASSAFHRCAHPWLDATDYDVVIEDELVHPSLFAVASFAGARFAGASSSGGGGAGERRPVRVALVHNLRSNQPRAGWRRLEAAIESRYLSGIDGVIAVCTRTCDDVQVLTNLALPALVARPGRDHLRPAVDDAMIAARARAPGPLRILHAAAVRPHKGLARLLDALARAAHRTSGAQGNPRGDAPALDFTLDVVGAIPRCAHARAIRRTIAARGWAGRVRLHGELRGEALHSLFRGSQLFALPSDREAYSLACLEALGFGLPVLATAAGGLAEMITDGQEGFLIAPDAIAAWAARLTELGADRARLGAMGRAARARYQAHARWSDVAGAVEGFLLERIREAGGGGTGG